MDIDRLMLAIVQSEDADTATNALNQAGLAVTRISSVGGLLKTRNVTLLIGLSASDVDRATAVLRAHCHWRSVPVHLPAPEATLPQSAFAPSSAADVGSAVVWVCPVTRHVRLGISHPLVDSTYQSVEPGTMQMVLAVVPGEQAGKLLERLTDWSYHATLISTTGGFLRRGNATLFIGVRSERVDSVIDQIRQAANATAVNDSVATIFVLTIARHERI